MGGAAAGALDRARRLERRDRGDDAPNGQQAARRSLPELREAAPNGWRLSQVEAARLGRPCAKREACEAFAAWERQELAAGKLSPPSAPPAGLDWAIVRTKPCGERQAARGCLRLGLIPYAPRERALLKGERVGWYVSDRPLLPGYLFVAHPMGRPLPFAEIEALPGSGPALAREGAPVMAPGRIVEALAAAEIAGRFDATARALAEAKAAKGRRYAAGTKVEIQSGPFAGFLARVERHERAGRVELLLALMGKANRLTVPEGMVAAVDGGGASVGEIAGGPRS